MHLFFVVGFVVCRVRVMRRVLLVVLGLLVAVGVCGYVALWWGVKREVFRNWVEQAASAVLGAEVRVKALRVRPWLVVEASGVRVLRSGGEEGELQRLELELVPWSLFSSEVVVGKLRLVEPKVVWRVGARGDGKSAARGRGIGQKGIAVQGGATRRSDSGAAEGMQQGERRWVWGEQGALGQRRWAWRSLRVESVALEQGRLNLLDSSGGVWAKLEGVRVDARLGSGGKEGWWARGLWNVRRGVFVREWELRDVSGVVEVERDRVEWREVRGDFYGGKFVGRFVAGVDGREVEFECSVVDCAVRELVQRRGQKGKGLEDARLSVFVKGKGVGGAEEDFVGDGEFFVGPVDLEKAAGMGRVVEVLEALGASVGELGKALRVEGVRGRFVWEEGEVVVPEVRSEPQDAGVRFVAKGRVKRDMQVVGRGEVELDVGRLDLPQKVVEVLGGAGADGYVRVPLLFVGKLWEPRVKVDWHRWSEKEGVVVLKKAAEVLERVSGAEDGRQLRRKVEQAVQSWREAFSWKKWQGEENQSSRDAEDVTKR